jgi:hypothetical protein
MVSGPSIIVVKFFDQHQLLGKMCGEPFYLNDLAFVY